MYSRVIYHVWLVVPIIAILACRACSALLCAQCETTTATSEACIVTAPMATACEGANGTNPRGVSCMITKIKSKSGEVISFVRGCTAVRVGTGCVDLPPNKTICYETCDTDNCNVAAVRARHSAKLVLYALCACLTLIRLAT